MDPVFVLLVVLLVFALGGMPVWGWGWGWGPSGIVGVLLAVLLVVILLRAFGGPRSGL
jgi:hypothetical protein